MLYLLGNEFDLVTDHKPIVSILKRPNSEPTARLEHWALGLQCFELKIVYREGNSNIAYTLSKLCLKKNCAAPVNFVRRKIEAHADCVAKSAVLIAIKCESIREASLECSETTLVVESWRAVTMNKCITAYQAVKCKLDECNNGL